jgi:DNA topoisomerase-1
MTQLTPLTTSSPKKKLFIVESPVKAKTIAKFLGDDYIICATVGHIADIPESSAIDVSNGFASHYKLTDNGTKVVKDLKKELKRCSEIILATDADREGEMIAAHVVEFLQPTVPVSRVVFNAVTETAVVDAMKTPREIDWNMVEAARTRRVIDRLFGFEVTGVSRSLIRSNVTAGRVQSPGLCLVVERELERLAFIPAEYMDVHVQSKTAPSFTAKLAEVMGRRIASGKDFNEKGELTSDVLVVSRKTAEEIASRLLEGAWQLEVSDIRTKPATANPKPPLDMSSLYQEAEYRLGMSTTETRAISNKLHHVSLISYPRADIRVHGAQTRQQIRSAIAKLYGKDLVCPFDRYTTSKKKLTQGAHEAIHPTNMHLQSPRGLSDREMMLYTLIWQHTMATQMASATGVSTSVTLQARKPGDTEVQCVFSASGTVYTELGYRRVYAPNTETEPEGLATFPELSIGDVVAVDAAEAKEHHTKAPPRYVAASLIKELEERGIGRPSTYESIIRKLKDRFVWSKPGSNALIPTVTGLAAYRMLQRSFSAIVDYDFTSNLEEQLDHIVEDSSLGLKILNDFYFDTNESTGLQTLVSDASVDVDPRDMFAIQLGEHPDSGHPMYIRPGRMRAGRFSPYVECNGITVSISDETCFEDFTAHEAVNLLQSHNPEPLGEIDGLPIYIKVTGTGGYFQQGTKDHLPDGMKKPRTASFLPGMNPREVTLEDAIQAFSLPRELGILETTGETVFVKVGPFGPYVQAGQETRSLKDKSAIFSITHAEACELLATPKTLRRRRKK